MELPFKSRSNSTRWKLNRSCNRNKRQVLYFTKYLYISHIYKRCISVIVLFMRFSLCTIFICIMKKFNNFINKNLTTSITGAKFIGPKNNTTLCENFPSANFAPNSHPLYIWIIYRDITYHSMFIKAYLLITIAFINFR